MGTFMTLTYEYGNNLYINLTNRCPNHCSFCLRNNSSGSLYAKDLWLKEGEPPREAYLEDLKSRDLDKYGEIVFCGYGEPCCRFDDMMWLCDEIKALGGHYKTRLNTNGQGDLIVGRPTAPEMAGRIDTVSVSLNADTAEKYQQLCLSEYGESAYNALLGFTGDAVKHLPNVFMTVVDTMSKEEIDNCRKMCEGLGARFRVRSYIKE